MAKSKQWQGIPTSLSVEQFDEFVLPHLTRGRRGPPLKLTLHKVFNYILLQLYLGCQWKSLPIQLRCDGQAEIHYTRVYHTFRRWMADGCIDAIFMGSVQALFDNNLLDTSVVHGDGTTTDAKKGGDNIAFSGHKHLRGDKVIPFCDRNCNVLAPFVSAPGNRNESPLLPGALAKLTGIARAVGINLRGSIVSLDGAYDSKVNRKMIFNRGMTPNINENPRSRKTTKRGPKRVFSAAICKERFRTIERVFAWEDKFRRVLVRYEFIADVHYAFKTLAYTMINLRHFCRS